MKQNSKDRPTRRARCDIRQGQDAIFMRLEMPGVNKANLDINVNGDQLVIDGRRMEESTKGQWISKEIHDGDYHMEYTIDETIDRESIKASLDKGVLELTLGLSESVKPRKIDVVSKS